MLINRVFRLNSSLIGAYVMLVYIGVWFNGISSLKVRLNFSVIIKLVNRVYIYIYIVYLV